MRHREYEQPHVTHVPNESDEFTKLIRKLRWIGMDQEARRLQKQLTDSPLCEKPSVLREPFYTD
jgi:hypothetical protein